MSDGTVFCTMPSPVGELLLTADATGLTRVYFDGHGGGHEGEPASTQGWRRDVTAEGRASDVLTAARAQIGAYFAGRLTAFDLPLAARGTPFQERVWAALRQIPFGQAISYAELARRVGAPGAARAVGAANRRNPLPIVVPCHRVVGAGGALTGFGGGLERKLWLLTHEGVVQSGGLPTGI
jgi:methylated-DNA-[protein]-cysteine S-methyltransferase